MRRTSMVPWLANWMRRAACALVLVHGAPAHAHDPGLSSVALTHGGRGGHFQIIVHDGDLPARRRASSGACVASGALALSLAERPLAIQIACRAHGSGHTAFEGRFSTPERGGLALELSLLEELPRGHLSFLRVFDAQGGLVVQHMLSRGAARVEVPRQAELRAATDFFVMGIEHIAMGLDHLLFLALVLLGVGGVSRMAMVVSSFTAAHSITLALATLQWVRLPAQWVESAIAASIVFVALRNCASAHGRPARERVATTFVFGLVHGLGFASALSELGVTGATRVVEPLLLFNLGVEAGQLALGVLALPALLYIQGSSWRRLSLARLLSGAAAVVGVIWFVERAFS